MPRGIRLYLDEILECVKRIREYLAGLDQDAFAVDRKTLDAVARNLEIIGEAARNLPDEARRAVPEIDWRKIIGLRNPLVHQYFGISVPIIWDIIQNKLEPLRLACKSLPGVQPPYTSA